jgi:hypothetical protein
LAAKKFEELSIEKTKKIKKNQKKDKKTKRKKRRLEEECGVLQGGLDQRGRGY